MAHLTLQLGGPIAVPFKIPFRNRRRRGLPGWKDRSRLEALAIDGGLPVLRIPLQRRHALHGGPYLIALDGDTLDRNEA